MKKALTLILITLITSTNFGQNTPDGQEIDSVNRELLKEKINDAGIQLDKSANADISATLTPILSFIGIATGGTGGIVIAIGGGITAIGFKIKAIIHKKKASQLLMQSTKQYHLPIGYEIVSSTGVAGKDANPDINNNKERALSTEEIVINSKLNSKIRESYSSIENVMKGDIVQFKTAYNDTITGIVLSTNKNKVKVAHFLKNGQRMIVEKSYKSLTKLVS